MTDGKLKVQINSEKNKTKMAKFQTR